jgi:hypothetical protein
MFRVEDFVAADQRFAFEAADRDWVLLTAGDRILLARSGMDLRGAAVDEMAVDASCSWVWPDRGVGRVETGVTVVNVVDFLRTVPFELASWAHGGLPTLLR